MQPKSTVTYEWKQSPSPTHRYRTGVSLHSHTSLSLESLTFIHGMFLKYPVLRSVFNRYERISRERHGITLDFVAAHWRPPLVPRMAFDLEARQIRELGLLPLVSITDHDCTQAPLLLRTMPSSRHIPVSLDERAFHPDRDGVMRPLAELWPRGHAPRLLQCAVGLVRLTRYRTVAAAIRLGLPRTPAELPESVGQKVA